MDEDRTVCTHEERIHTPWPSGNDQKISATEARIDVAMVDLQAQRALRTLKQDINALLDRLPDSSMGQDARRLRLELMAELGHKSDQLRDLMSEIRCSDR